MSTVHYTLHALFQGHLLSSNNVDKTTIFIACIKCRLKSREPPKTNPCGKGFLGLVRWNSTLNVYEYSCKMYQFSTSIQVFISDSRLQFGDNALRCWAGDWIDHLSGWCLFLPHCFWGARSLLTDRPLWLTQHCQLLAQQLAGQKSSFIGHSAETTVSSQQKHPPKWMTQTPS